jgi:hypothetical protein
MDIMANITLAGDASLHVCEIQIVHSKMLVARKNLGGHKPYAQLRAATEILEVLNCERAAATSLKSKSSKFSLKSLLTSSSQSVANTGETVKLGNEQHVARRASPPPPFTPPQHVTTGSTQRGAPEGFV